MSLWPELDRRLPPPAPKVKPAPKAKKGRSKNPKSPLMFDCHNGEECYLRLDYLNKWYVRGIGEARIGRRLQVRYSSAWCPLYDRDASAEMLLGYAASKGWTMMGGHSFLPEATDFEDIEQKPKLKGKKAMCLKCKGHGYWNWIKRFWPAPTAFESFKGRCPECNGKGWL